MASTRASVNPRPQLQDLDTEHFTDLDSAAFTLSKKMCVNVQPICNACSTNAKRVELHECIFRDCQYPEECTRFLSRHELLEWDCDTPDCGLNMETINNRLAEIDRMLRMEIDLPLRPAEGDSLGSHDDNDDGQADPNLHGLDGDDSASTRDATRSNAGVDVTPHGDDSPDNTVANDNIAGNDSTATNDNVANESVETVFDPDSVDLNTFPRCRHCFLARRRCDGQTPCDKCRQRRCPRACRPVTVELLRQYPDRAERVLRLARRNGAGS